MDATRDDPLRAFPGTVRAAFRFLESQYGFHVAGADDARVRYESEHVFVSVARCPGGTQLRLEIGRRDGAGRPLTLADVLAAPDREPRSEADIVARNVLEVASVVRLFGHPLLLGDPAAFDRLEARRTGRRGPG
jgi:hypothetical protein